MATTVTVKIPTTTIPGNDWPKIYSDSSIDEGSVFCYDALDTNCWPSQATPTTGQALVNLVTGVADAPFVGFFNGLWRPFASKGFVLDVNTGYHIKLPDAAKLPANTDNFLAVIWLYFNNQTQGNWTVFGWGDTGPYEIRSDGGSQNMRCGSAIQSLGVSQIALHQLVIAREKRLDGTFAFHKLIDGVLVSTAAGPSSLQQPSNPATDAAIGDVPGGGPGYFDGRFHRAFLTTKYRTTAEIQAWVAADYAANSTRFV